VEVNLHRRAIHHDLLRLGNLPARPSIALRPYVSPNLGGVNGLCIDVAFVGNNAATRDSKNKAGPVLIASEQWRVLADSGSTAQ
jgi:hypothetical protein